MSALQQHPAITALIRFDNRTERLLLVLGGITVVGFVFTVFTDVIFRTFFSPIVWMEEVSRLLYMWSIFLGSAVAFRHGAHFKIDILALQKSHCPPDACGSGIPAECDFCRGSALFWTSVCSAGDCKEISPLGNSADCLPDVLSRKRSVYALVLH